MVHYDAVVLGLGALGSTTTYQLAARGCRVLAIDQFYPPHQYGSTHGDTRMTRLAMGEGDRYMPLAQRAYDLWLELEHKTTESLFLRNGGLILSRQTGGDTPTGNFLGETIAIAEKYGVHHELLEAKDIRERFPEFNVCDNDLGYYEPGAGFLRAERCVMAQISLAKMHGADVHFGEKVVSFNMNGNKLAVSTDISTYSTTKLIIAAGPWLPSLLGEKYSKLFKIYRQVMFWFAIAKPDRFGVGRFPVFIWDLGQDKQGIYGFPAVNGPNGGVKIASEKYETPTTADAHSTNVSELEISAMYENYVRPYLNDVEQVCVKAEPCLYTTTPDSDFVLDQHPDFESVIIASACSGHGFKHSIAIGEALSEMVIQGRSRIDLSPFSLSRFNRAHYCWT